MGPKLRAFFGAPQAPLGSKMGWQVQLPILFLELFSVFLERLWEPPSRTGA